MNEVLTLIDDLKKVKQKLVSGDTAGAIKLIDETVAYKEIEVKDFETWLENEHKLEQSGVEEHYGGRGRCEEATEQDGNYQESAQIRHNFRSETKAGVY